MKDVTIIIKTMNRYICLKPLLKSILKKYPDIPILIGDDGIKTCKREVERDFPQKNIKFYELPYDCGLSKGRNFLVNKVKTNYFCLCDDDFVFEKKTDLEEALMMIKEKDLDILGGYIRNYKIVTSWKDYLIRFAQRILHYELPTNYIASMKEKDHILSIDYRIKDFPEYEETDVVLNFFIAKTDTIKRNPWDEDLKLQEHTAFFYVAKKKHLKVAFTNKLSTRHCPIQSSKYKTFRTRNYTHVFLEKHGIQKVVSNYDIRPTQETNYTKLDPIFISVVIPAYNAENKMDSLIKTLKDQTYKNFEVIIVDNNSKDHTREYLKEKTKDDKRFKIYSEKMQGPNYARKKGFEKTSGEYIYFCDADDYLEDDTLYHFASEITKNKSDIVIGNYIEHQGENQRLMKGMPFSYDGNLKKYRNILHVKPALWNKIFKKDLIDQDSFVFTMIGEDMFITALAMIRAKKITCIDKVVYHYILEENGLSSKVHAKNFMNLVDTQNAIRGNLERIKLYDKWQEEMEYIFITHLVYKIFRVTLLPKKEEKKKVYNVLYSQLQIYSKENKYLKQSKAFSFAYFVVNHKGIFSFFSPCIKMLFTNKL